NAYVSGGKLVATFQEAGLRILLGLTDIVQVNLDFRLHAAYIVCDVVPTDAGKWSFTLRNCTLAGRWVADDLVKQLAKMPDPRDIQNPNPLCTGSASSAAFKDNICRLRDIASTFGGPTAPCDALSFAANLDYEPALFGDVYGKQPPTPQCPPGTDPADDSCESDGGTSSSAGGVGGAGGRGGMDAGTKDASEH